MSQTVMEWLLAHGFELNNREWASIFWATLLFVVAMRNAEVRKSVKRVIFRASDFKMLVLWTVHGIWVLLFVAVANRVGVWRSELTKETLFWAVTAGVVALIRSPEAAQPGYFRRSVVQAISVAVFLEYLVTSASFPLWIEIVLQPLAFILAVAPIIDSKDKEFWHPIQTRFFTVLSLGMVGHTALKLYTTRATIDWNLFLLRAIWPILLALWILPLVFVVLIVASYEEAFIRLDFYHPRKRATLKAKIGLVLALRLQLRWIHEAAKGGTFHVANADTVRKALQAAMKFKADRIAEAEREAEY